ncbi:integrase [Herbaspirillum sp. Sphag1AN]|uniref:site-specific integrase n=1 Tax=unclassified Herbaspirillum TaxID=2624150 RepID=UPI00160ED5BA|nr:MULTISPECIES: site-specific integrase [unclassified Herbaspirillum]MBB3213955.1 integrase [Herbaspirillum sp. Sphag1AN]MBB3247152.1 integrase [Herbaspirillum sp. Sphag64]
MATISKRGSMWRCQVRKQGYPTQTKSFEQRSSAIAWANEVEAQMHRGTYIGSTSSQSTTVQEILSQYLKDESRKKAYPAADISRSKPLLAALGGYHVHNLSHADLARYKATRLATVSPQTVTHELNLLHRAYVLAVNEWGVILPNGIPKTSRPRLPPGRGTRISPEDIERIVNVTESPQLKLIVPLAVETAMRRSELLAIRWENVNLSRCSIYLPRTKNGMSRTVPLSSKALAVIGELKQAKEGPLFTLAASSVSQAFDRAVSRAGLKGVRFHDLRHEATSRLFEKGLHVIEVARITGHKTLAMLDRYTHLDVSQLVRKLE